MFMQEIVKNYHKDEGPPRCALKVDIQKACDSVRWGFLRRHFQRSKGVKTRRSNLCYLFWLVTGAFSSLIKTEVKISD